MKGRVAHNTDNTEDLSNDSEDDDESDSGPNFAEPRDIKPLPVENQVQEVKDSPAKDRKDDENVEDQITEIEPLLNRKKSLAKAPKATNVVKTKDNRILKFENAPIRNINPDDLGPMPDKVKIKQVNNTTVYYFDSIKSNIDPRYFFDKSVKTKSNRSEEIMQKIESYYDKKQFKVFSYLSMNFNRAGHMIN